eukprot:1149340-Pelagomonas_calceolata.AAC.1
MKLPGWSCAASYFFITSHTAEYPMARSDQDSIRTAGGASILIRNAGVKEAPFCFSQPALVGRSKLRETFVLSAALVGRYSYVIPLLLIRAWNLQQLVAFEMRLAHCTRRRARYPAPFASAKPLVGRTHAYIVWLEQLSRPSSQTTWLKASSCTF